MRTTATGWRVIDADATILTWTYAFDGSASANCFVVRMGDGRLLVVSPACRMPKAAFQELGRYGQVGAVLANNGMHYLGLVEWRERFPHARFFATPESAARIGAKSPYAPPLESLDALRPLLGEALIVQEAPSPRCGETWVIARTTRGSVWFVSDLFTNMDRIEGPFIARLLFRLTNSAPGFRIFNLALNFTVRDRKQVLSRLLADVTRHPPAVMVPSHGEILHRPSLASETRRLIVDALGARG